MRIGDIFVEVRDINLERQGLILPRDLSLKAKLRWCGVGEWELTLPQNHPRVPDLLTEGSGLIVRGPRPGGIGVLFSGPTTVPKRVRDIKNPDGTLTFKGVTDDIFLEDALAFPSPAVADPNAQTAANDIRTASAETLMREYVSENLVTGVAPSGRVRGLRSSLALSGADATRGATLTKSPRFQNLLELLQEIAVGSPDPGTLGLGFRVVQNDEALEFEVIEIRDQRDIVRLDIANGTITSEEVQIQGPSLTDAIVAGQGEGTERTMVQVKDTAGEALWGRPIERFFDRRDTDDPNELLQKAEEELTTAAGGAAVKLVPTDDQTMRYGFDWIEGDWVTAVVNGVETDSVITETVFLFDSSKVAVGAAIGDVTTFNPADTQKRTQQTLDSRIGYLERATAREALSIGGQRVLNWDDAMDTGFYWGNGASNSPDAAVSYWVVTVQQMPGNTGGLRVKQIAHRPDRADGQFFERTWNSGGSGAWGTWRSVVGTLPDAVYKTGIASTTLSGAVLSWQALTGVSYTIPAQPRDLWLEVSATAIVKASTGYTMIGVDISGGIALAPTILPDGTDYSGATPFSASTLDTAISMHPKRVLLAAGDTATFAMLTRRSVASGTQTCNYPIMSIKPLNWAE